MWQRIQTLYLALIAILSIVMCFQTTAYMMAESTGAIYQFKFPGVVTASGDTYMGMFFLYLLLFIIAALAVLTIFMYKKRKLQIRLTILNILLMVGYYALLFWHVFVAKARLESEGIAVEWHLNIAFCFQLVNIVLAVMAIRAILKDEALVRSADRLRS